MLAQERIPPRASNRPKKELAKYEVLIKAAVETSETLGQDPGGNDSLCELHARRDVVQAIIESLAPPRSQRTRFRKRMLSTTKFTRSKKRPTG